MNAAPAIFTIGYGARDLDAFLALLRAHEIAFLIDVRSAPYSRFKPEFARKALENALHGAGIRYVYMGNVLGGQPDDRSCYDAAGKVLYDRVQETAAYRQGIDRVRKAFDQGLRVALMCSEGKPELCHRSKLIGETLARLGLPVQHIDENDALESQEAVRDRLTAGQLSLWDDYGFTSRKRYNEEAEDA
ncbi:MAG: DUF488 domain-containing protein [Caldilineales bacterium]|nr:DUF488 domain-containing protein [Caldilineales bacterium]